MDHYEKMLVIIVLLIFFGELNVLIQPKFVNSASVNLTNIRYGSSRIEISYSVKQGTYPSSLQVALLPVYSLVGDKEIYVYFDRDYPSSSVPLSSWIGIIDNLQVNLKLKGYNGKLEIVDASELKDVMAQKFDSIVIVPSGVLPETVHTQGNTLVKQYLENGGIMLWVGDIFASYSGGYQGEISSESPQNPRLIAQKEILGYTVSNVSEFDLADTETRYSEALSLKYSGVRFGIIADEVVKHQGLVLGKVRGNWTSIGMVPVGDGFLVLFGGKVTPSRTPTGEDLVAGDMANILLSGIIYSKGQLSYNTISRENVSSENLSVDFNGSVPLGVVFLAVSNDYYSYFFYRQFIIKP